jgi:hypothetical protein
MSQIYDKIKEEIQDTWFQHNFSNDGQKFVAWYLRNIHLRDRVETKDDITDGSDDKQIDAIVVDDDKSIIYIVQGKFYSGKTVDAEPLREVLAAWLQLRDLERLQSVSNQKLQRKLAEIAKARDDDYEVCFELVTTSTLTDAAKHDLETFQKELTKISENENWDATVSLVDEDELTKRYELAAEKDNPSINYSLPLLDCKYLSETIAGTQVVLAAVPLKTCLEFPGIKDGSLFQKNVRQSLGLNNNVDRKSVV